MPNDSKLSSTNTSNPSLSGTSQKNASGSNAVDWLKKKTGTAIKKVNRLEEKFSQAIGKAQKTEDEIFESNVTAFEDQSQAANLFYKELNKYIVSLRETQKNQKNFHECLKQVYEQSWPGYHDLIQQCQKQEELWTQHIDLLQQCVQVPASQYLKEFPECKKQIEKRTNKLLDFDKARHSLHDLEGAKKPDEIRIQRAKADLQEKKGLYEDLNTDLRSRLPKLFEERKVVYSKVFKSLFNIEKSFYNNMHESKKYLNDMCDTLLESFNVNDDNTYMPSNGSENGNGQACGVPDEDDDKPSAYEFAVDTLNNSQNNNNSNNNNKPPVIQLKKTESNGMGSRSQQPQPQPSLSSSSSTSSINSPTSQAKSPILSSTTTEFNASATTNTKQDLYGGLLNDAIRQSVSTPQANESSKGPKVLYKVKATYPYQAKEIDELTFNKEDLIEVIEGTESEKEDLDEGWLIGIHCQSQARGLFPENFTKRV